MFTFIRVALVTVSFDSNSNVNKEPLPINYNYISVSQAFLWLACPSILTVAYNISAHTCYSKTIYHLHLMCD